MKSLFNSCEDYGLNRFSYLGCMVNDGDFHSFYMHLLDAYCMPGTGAAAGLQQKVPAAWRLV